MPTCENCKMYYIGNMLELLWDVILKHCKLCISVEKDIEKHKEHWVKARGESNQVCAQHFKFIVFTKKLIDKSYEYFFIILALGILFKN